ncbi:hypothetical protein [Tsukamurella spumae]|uniref:Uncharacterized protein n=1 Tax=Tsukamurella spumae TaxID=44753 RepID=A0A846X995_9ACTN|nr:hypothetical protein [Tsukamurella spumae]NKY20792.1 hypothetical protein [Tsukamurella spumae]
MQRTIRQLDPYERESTVFACRRGGRRRWERELGSEVMREPLGEEQAGPRPLCVIAQRYRSARQPAEAT